MAKTKIEGNGADKITNNSLPPNIKLIEQMESNYLIENEERFFKNLVNPSLNKEKPYYRWARYREAYSGELVKELISRSKINPKKHFIYDPMSGAGSTLLAATEMGFDSVGNDINPYAVDVTNAKLQHYDNKSLSVVLDFVSHKKVPSIAGTAHFQRFMQNCERYFEEDHSKVLQKISDEISKISNTKARTLLDAVWLTILEDCSNRKKDGNGLATRATKVKDAWEHFKDSAHKVVEDIKSSPLPSNVLAKNIFETSLKASAVVKEFSKDSQKKLGAIIFSPPYANSFDYFESYKLEMLCGYYTQKELIEARKMAIRSYRKGYGHDLGTENVILNKICEHIKKRIPTKEKRTGVIDNRSRLVPNLLIGYFEDMGKTLMEFSKCMPKGSLCYVVVDQSSYLGVIVPTDLILAELGEKFGLSVERIIHCRTAKTSAQQIKEYPYLKTMLRESIVVFKK